MSTVWMCTCRVTSTPCSDLKPDGHPHQFISGAGSELTHVTAGVPYSRFEASENGFLYFSMDSKRLNVKAINHTGKMLYETELTK